MSQAYRKNGTAYTPEYIELLNAENCIGCGRCYKVCNHEVFELLDREDLEIEDDEYEDEGAMVMVLKNDGNCIGCKACANVCPRKCQTFTTLAA